MVFGRRGIVAASLAALLGVVVSIAPNAQAQGGTLRSPGALGDLALATPLEASRKLDESLMGATGRVEVVVRLTQGPAATAASQRGQRNLVSRQQDEVIAAVRAIDPSARLLGRARMVLNAVMFEVEASALNALAADGRVIKINPVVNYQRDLSETVPYIGARPEVQSAGFRGKDVKVAVLDSGIDYTHVAFGGAGTAAAYEAAWGASPSDPRNTTRDGLFPTARVVEGFDFVGEAWTGGAGSPPLAPDPDPIDLEGHGTHVADIIGGAIGVAPAVNLYAVKVCSAVSTSCSGVALIQGMDYVADPNGDGSTSDHIDIVNMSLGSPYGQNYDDDLSTAVDVATAVGILTVASAGNSADKPYITGSPAAARTALSVAQTAVPSDQAFAVSVGGLTVYGIAQPWAPNPSGVISGPLFYDTTNAGTRLGCSNAAGASPWTGTPLAGRIVLVDRGTCAISLKGSNAAAAGALAVIVANNTAGNVPPSFGFGGGTPTVPVLSITQAAGLSLRPLSGQTATIDASLASSTVGSVVGTSSRGPNAGQMFYGNSVQFGQLIKPEIGAPGASISAVAGSGTGTEPFGGTSGAAPMVAGAAALLHNATNWQLSPLELKTRLMNTGDTSTLGTPGVFGGALAPITLIGGGELRIDRAIGSQVSAWESVSRGGALSFGFVDASKDTTLTRRVVVRNYGSKSITLNITPEFRYANDTANGAVSVSVQGNVTVPARGQRIITVRLSVDTARLRAWTLNSGSQGGNGDTLTALEYDGYLRFSDASGNSANSIHMPWHVLPRLSGNVKGPSTVPANGTASYTNGGDGAAFIDAYSLLGTSGILPAGGVGQQSPAIDLKAVGYSTFNGAGVCPNPTGGGTNYILSLAVANHYRQTHANAPGAIDIFLDTNRDGVDDFEVLTFDAAYPNLSDGRSLTWVFNLRTGSGGAFFFTQHPTNGANFVLNICASQLVDATRPAALGGPLLAPAIGQPIDADFTTFDIYFLGVEKDSIKDVTFAPGGERYVGLIDDIAPGGSAQLSVLSTGSTTNPSENGVLLLLDGVRAGGASSGAIDGKESIVVTVR